MRAPALGRVLERAQDRGPARARGQARGAAPERGRAPAPGQGPAPGLGPARERERDCGAAPVEPAAVLACRGPRGGSRRPPAALVPVPAVAAAWGAAGVPERPPGPGRPRVLPRRRRRAPRPPHRGARDRPGRRAGGGAGVRGRRGARGRPDCSDPRFLNCLIHTKVREASNGRWSRRRAVCFCSGGQPWSKRQGPGRRPRRG